MGEYIFNCLAALFENPEYAKRVVKYVKAVLHDLSNLYEDWASIRSRTDISVTERHVYLLNRHPLVRKYVELPSPVEEDVFMDYLKMHIDVHVDEHFEIRQYHDEVRVKSRVHGFADWTNISNFLYRLGAEKVAWINSWYINYMFVGLCHELAIMDKPSLKLEPIKLDEIEEDLIRYGYKSG